jgi:uncharacterized phage protein (TIGR01671 family)
MREIGFKAKRIDNGEWVEGFLYVRKDGVAEINYYNNDLGIERYTHEVEPDTICQYTGLTDKNGNKIWENDVVEGLFLYGAKVSAIVDFENGAFGLKWSRGNVEEFSPFTSICNVSFEVIGNIFSGYTKH